MKDISRATVLVVDDEAIVRLGAEESLRDAGFDTVGAANGEEALAKLAARWDIAVIISDIDMPGGFDGLELARRAHRLRPDVHTILTSGKCAPPPASRGCNAFLPKPYSPVAMVRAVEAMLAERRPA